MFNVVRGVIKEVRPTGPPGPQGEMTYEGQLLPPEALYCIQRSYHDEYTLNKLREAQDLKRRGRADFVHLEFRPKPIFRRELKAFQRKWDLD